MEQPAQRDLAARDAPGDVLLQNGIILAPTSDELDALIADTQAAISSSQAAPNDSDGIILAPTSDELDALIADTQAAISSSQAAPNDSDPAAADAVEFNNPFGRPGQQCSECGKVISDDLKCASGLQCTESQLRLKSADMKRLFRKQKKKFAKKRAVKELVAWMNDREAKVLRSIHNTATRILKPQQASVPSQHQAQQLATTVSRGSSVVAGPAQPAQPYSAIPFSLPQQLYHTPTNSQQSPAGQQSTPTSSAAFAMPLGFGEFQQQFRRRLNDPDFDRARHAAALAEADTQARARMWEANRANNAAGICPQLQGSWLPQLPLAVTSATGDPYAASDMTVEVPALPEHNVAPEVTSATGDPYAANRSNNAAGICPQLQGSWLPQLPLAVTSATGDPYAASDMTVEVPALPEHNVAPEVTSATGDPYAANRANNAAGICPQLQGSWLPQLPLAVTSATGDPYAASDMTVEVPALPEHNFAHEGSFPETYMDDLEVPALPEHNFAHEGSFPETYMDDLALLGAELMGSEPASGAGCGSALSTDSGPADSGPSKERQFEEWLSTKTVYATAGAALACSYQMQSAAVGDGIWRVKNLVALLGIVHGSALLLPCLRQKLVPYSPIMWCVLCPCIPLMALVNIFQSSLSRRQIEIQRMDHALDTGEFTINCIIPAVAQVLLCCPLPAQLFSFSIFSCFALANGVILSESKGDYDLVTRMATEGLLYAWLSFVITHLIVSRLKPLWNKCELVTTCGA